MNYYNNLKDIYQEVDYMSTDTRARLVQFIEESVYKFAEAETATFIVNDIIKILDRRDAGQGNLTGRLFFLLFDFYKKLLYNYYRK